jgi:hypothetical protein
MREQGRRHLDHRQAAHERRPGEARQVAHDATPDRDDGGGPVEAVSDERVPEPLGLPEALALLAFRHHEDRGLEAGAPEALRHARRVCRDGGLRDDRRPAAEAQLGARRSGRVEKTRPDLDRVAPGPEMHHDLSHRLASLYLVKK